MATTTSKLENEDPSRAPTSEEASGLNIQRLVSFGFVVGRFSRDRRTSEHNLLVAYAKMNGGFGNDGVSRRITVPTLLETESGQAIPSFVAIDDEKKILVGQVAKYHAIGYPADSFFNIKTLLGRKFHDSQIQELKTKVPYKINEGSNGEAWVEACNEQFSPTKLCAFIIDKMKRLAESYLGRSISKAVIAAPIYFNDAQKKELELAGKLAGLDVLVIVDEPLVASPPRT
ncbi:hypothetical protein LOK49_LG11G00011 [Camellia lanceoleosa]|uniref:Uncharacterized protein n=1 Tax=Camellia lanceoleosa TaxID=1840588 RepID=A0ACC0G493_9ERIC|nr:hypothetical protein LOK49_LG11G00011 [Camellia lanceoleosa]